MELGSGEILLILIVALLIYGGRLPEVARAIGKSVGELKRGLSETKDAVSKDLGGGVGADVRDTLRDVRREVERAAEPAPEHLAKEDVSKPDVAGAPPPTDAMPHEHPN